MRHGTSNDKSRLFGYEVIQRLGEGAGSSLYAVDHPESRQIRALKHVVRRTEHDDRFIEQLQNEFEVGHRVDHPRLRRCFEFKVHRNWFHKIAEAALLMELVDGTPLETRHPPVHEQVGAFHQTAEALHSLHVSGFIHCDIKPNNILISDNGHVKVIDFGQACPNGTKKKRIQGTPQYIAPEQFRCEPVTTRTDIFNLGATMYWSLCRRHIPTLCTVKNSGNSFLLIEGIPTPRGLNEEVPEPLSSLVMECIRSNPDKRPQCMSELKHRLDAVQYRFEHHRKQGRRVPRPISAPDDHRLRA